MTANPRLPWLRLGLLYSLIFGAILMFAYLGKLPGFLSHMDKPGHVILYGIFTWLGHRAFPQQRLGRWPLFPLGFGLFTLVEELSQSLSPHRTLDVGDLVCSFAGIAIGYSLAQWQIRRQNPRPIQRSDPR
jgi:hypothetical protein